MIPMKGLMNRSLRMVQTGSILLILFMTGCATSPNWREFSPSQFPASVRAIVLEDGITIDRYHTAKWGNWTVSFPDSSLPVARRKLPWDLDFPIYINLTCSNPVIGARDCYVFLYNAVSKDCSVQSRKDNEQARSEDLMNINIACPTALLLEGS